MIINESSFVKMKIIELSSHVHVQGKGAPILLLSSLHTFDVHLQLYDNDRDAIKLLLGLQPG